MDATRQMVTRLDEVRADHRERYAFACTIAEGVVLDAACGVGYGSKMLMDAGHRVVGVDVEADALLHAVEHFTGPDYLCADLQNMELPPCDTVVSFETVEHLKHPEWFLRAARAIGKLLIVSTPNQEHYPFDPVRFAGDKYPHQRHYTPAEFDILLEGCGWTVVDRFCQVGKTSAVTHGTDGMFLVYVCR